MRKCLVLLSLIVAGCGSGAGSGSNESLTGRWQVKNSQWGEAGVNSTVDFEGSVLTIAATAASQAGETAQVIVKGTFAESAGKLSLKATGVDNLGDLGNSKATLGPILAEAGILASAGESKEFTMTRSGAKMSLTGGDNKSYELEKI